MDDKELRARKRRRTAQIQKRMVNPVIRRLIRLGFFPSVFALLETTGRRTGQPRITPVGNGLDGDTFWLIAEHGAHCDYVKNLLTGPRVRVRIARRWRIGTATIVPGDDGLARRRAIDRANGLMGRFDGVIFRGNATDTATIRIDLDPF